MDKMVVVFFQDSRCFWFGKNKKEEGEKSKKKRGAGGRYFSKNKNYTSIFGSNFLNFAIFKPPKALFFFINMIRRYFFLSLPEGSEVTFAKNLESVKIRDFLQKKPIYFLILYL